MPFLKRQFCMHVLFAFAYEKAQIITNIKRLKNTLYNLNIKWKH
jgi:hypothetical protein